jgi:16S rRNA U516 pseudouridylate synthase RsuA-like enzyme
VGLIILSLKRLRIGPVALGDLPEGHIRKLTEGEVTSLWLRGKR